MTRTQIYLTSSQNQSLIHLSHLLDQGKSELIRRAIDEFLSRREKNDKLKKLRSARGMWAGRKDILDIRKLRSEFDRF